MGKDRNEATAISEPDQFICVNCKKVFSCRQLLWRYKQKCRRLNTKLFSCGKCEKEFPRLDNLNRRMLQIVT